MCCSAIGGQHSSLSSPLIATCLAGCHTIEDQYLLGNLNIGAFSKSF